MRWFAACALVVLLLAPDGRSIAADSAVVDLPRSLASEVDAYVEADRQSPPEPCRILFVGSSSIVRWRDTLAADMAPLPVVNRGFGGSHIEHVNRWFDQLVLPHRPRAIVFYAGENDLAAGKSVARVIRDFDRFMRLKVRALGTTPVYFISLKPSKLRIAQLMQQGAVNRAIRQRAHQRSDLHFIDVASAMLDHGRPRELFGPDDLHMNRSGYELWARIVKAALLPESAAQLGHCKRRNRL